MPETIKNATLSAKLAATSWEEFPHEYRALHAGKWHLAAQQTTAGPDVDKHNWPLQRGFDHGYSMITGAGSYYTPNTLTWDNKPIDSFPKDFYFTNAIAEHSARMIAEGDPEQPFFLYCAFNSPHWPIQAPEDLIQKYARRYAGGWDALRMERYSK